MLAPSKVSLAQDVGASYVHKVGRIKKVIVKADSDSELKRQKKVLKKSGPLCGNEVIEHKRNLENGTKMIMMPTETIRGTAKHFFKNTKTLLERGTGKCDYLNVLLEGRMVINTKGTMAKTADQNGYRKTQESTTETNKN